MRRSAKALVVAGGSCLLHDDFRRVGVLAASCPYDASGGRLRAVAYPGGAGWACADGTVLNTPAAGAEMLADPGLEGSYTAGKCDALSVMGSPTLAQSADAHGGSKAQQFTGTAKDDRLYASIAASAGQWYRGQAWARRTAGTGGTARIAITGVAADNLTPSPPIASVEYHLYRVTQRANATAGAVVRVAWDSGIAAFDTVVVDDVSMAPLPLAALLNVPDLGASDVVAELDLAALPVGVQCGIALRWDSQSAPASGILVYADGLGGIRASKRVAGVVTAGIVVGTVSGGGTCRVRLVGDTLSVTYKGAAVGPPASVADVPRGVRHGLFATDPSANQATRLTIWRG